MESWLAKAVLEITLMEATALSIFLALGLAWLGLRGFFRMLVITGTSQAGAKTYPVARTAARRSVGRDLIAGMSVEVRTKGGKKSCCF